MDEYYIKAIVDCGNVDDDRKLLLWSVSENAEQITDSDRVEGFGTLY